LKRPLCATAFGYLSALTPKHPRTAPQGCRILDVRTSAHHPMSCRFAAQGRTPNNQTVEHRTSSVSRASVSKET
jgi:hypothetical protein